MGYHDILLDSAVKLKAQLRDMLFQHYLTHELFSWAWWFDIAIITIAFVIWWKVIDKKRLLEICVFGLLVNMIATFLDVMGSDFVLWDYPVHVIPQLTILLPVDYVVVPIINMIIYQKFLKWRQYLFISTIAAAILAFVAEPLAVLIGQYTLIKWKFIYSFPIYILISIIAKFSTEWFKSKQTSQIH